MTLKEKYQGLYITHGKNSDEAKKVAKEIDKLSSELKENKGKLQDAEKAADKFDKTLDETGDSSVSAGSRIGGALKTIGSIVGAAFAVDKIKDFGMSCIEASANAQAMNSQFSQVFGDLEQKASDSLSKMADSTGIVENRMKGSFTQIAAFAKTTGMDTESALGLSERAMVAVADSAAFYDRSLEECTESLQSFLKGNYENDAALGLSCTEVTRNEAANKLYGKSFKELDESQKQLTLLQMVEDANAASGALGQAARESDTWTNAMGNLKQIWEDFKALIGGPILNIVLPAIQGITDKIGKMKTTIENSGSVFDGFKTIISNFASKIQEAIPKVVSKAAEMMKQFGEKIKENLPEIVTKALDMIEGFADMIAQNLPTLIQAGIEMLKNIAQGIVDAIPVLIEKVPTIVSKFANLINDNAPTILAAGFDILVTLGKGLIDAIPTLIDNIPKIIQAIWDTFTAFNWLNLGKNLINGIKNGVKNAGEGLKNGVKNIFENIKNGISNISTATKNVASNIWNGLKNGVSNIASGLKNFVVGIWNGIKSMTSSIFGGVKSVASTIWNGIKSTISGVVNGVKSVVSSVWNGIKSTTSSVFNGIKSKATSVWDSIKSAITKPIESAKNAVKSAIDKMKSFFNFSWSLPKIKLPHFHKSGEFSLNPPSVPSFSVEWYKKAMDTPMMFTQPTIFGINPATGQMKGAGEAGDEVMIGKNTMLNMIQTAVSAEISSFGELLQKIVDILLDFFPQFAEGQNIVLDDGTLVGRMSYGMDKELGDINRLKERGA